MAASRDGTVRVWDPWNAWQWFLQEGEVEGHERSRVELLGSSLLKK